MQIQSGYKTTRANASIRSRNSLLKQTANAKSFHETISDEYFQHNVKSPSSGNMNMDFSPKKFSIGPNTTKHSNEYYFKGKESFSSALLPKKTVKTPSMNINTEFQTEKVFTANNSIFEQSNKAFSTREYKPKTNLKRTSVLESKQNLDLASIDNGLAKSGGPNSAASPKSKLKIETGSQSQSSRVGEYFSATMTMNKTQLHAEGEMTTKEEKIAQNVPTDSRTTATMSHRRSSTTQDPDWGNLKLPADPQFVLKNFGSYLSPYEKDEITKYTQIYYISDIYHKILARGEQEYEDDRGDYLVVKNDHIRYRYEALEMLGKGSFGQVLKVYDHKRKEYAAVKVIRSPKKFHFQAKIEIKVLKYMMENYGADYNVIGLRDYFIFRNHVCLVFDLMDLNLYDLLKKNKFKGFPLNTVRKFAIQVLYALKFLNHHKIIHCDLKPENILLKHPGKTGVKLIDFGSSCFENEKLYTYIQSRFYRSPEIILGLPYSTQIDMWSFGCLLCELYLGYPVFAGDSERDQLYSMFEVLGLPDPKLIDAAPRKSKYFDAVCDPLDVQNTKGKVRVPNSSPLAGFFKEGDEKFLDLVKMCLEFDPTKRFSADQALAHEWIIEGLPPQLQVQHLKFIKETAPGERKEEKNSTPSSAKGLRVQALRSVNVDEPVNYHPDTLRSQVSVDTKVMPNLSMRAGQTQEDKVQERSLEPDETSSPLSAKQKKVFTRKLNGLPKEKLSVRTMHRQIGPSTTKNAVYSSVERDDETPSSKKGSVRLFQKNNKMGSELPKALTKKAEGDESSPKNSLVTWDGAGTARKSMRYEDKSLKASTDLSQGKKTMNYFNFYSPKASHSVEKSLSKGEKDAAFAPYKNSMLPSLKLTLGQKKGNN